MVLRSNITILQVCKDSPAYLRIARRQGQVFGCAHPLSRAQQSKFLVRDSASPLLSDIAAEMGTLILPGFGFKLSDSAIARDLYRRFLALGLRWPDPRRLEASSMISSMWAASWPRSGKSCAASAKPRGLREPIRLRSGSIP